MPKEVCQDIPTEKELDTQSKRNIELLKSSIGVPMQNLPLAPFTKWLNGRLLAVERGQITVKYKLRPEMANPTGILHGGLQCALIDELIGIACYSLGYPGFHLSIDISVNYLGRVKVDEEILCTSRVVREGKKIVNAEAEIRDLKENIIATGYSNLLVTSKKLNILENV